jgi:hypothetical protein
LQSVDLFLLRKNRDPLDQISLVHGIGKIGNDNAFPVTLTLDIRFAADCDDASAC